MTQTTRDSKAAADGELAQLRAEIERLDEELLGALDARLALVERVGAAKRAAGAAQPFRPQRERARLDAIARASQARGLAPAAALAIWREMMGAALARQARVQLVAPPALSAWARAQFGHSLPCAPAAPHEALTRAAHDPLALAVLPLAEEGGAPWWTQPLPTPVTIVAALPFWSDGDGRIAALCAAQPIAEEEVFPVWRIAHAPEESEAVGAAGDALCLARARTAALLALPPDVPLPRDGRVLGAVLPPLHLKTGGDTASPPQAQT